MARHRVYGLTLDADLPLPELPAASGPPDITVAADPSVFRPPSSAFRPPPSVLRPPSSGWFDIWLDRGRSSVRAARVEDGYLVRHADLATVHIASASRTITYDASRCPETTLRHFLLDQALPLMLSLDSLVLHASSVAAGDGISAFVGPGGAGKSTVALALSRCGYPMTSDDALPLRVESSGVTAVPAYPWVRVRHDSAAALNAVEPPSFTLVAAPLTNVYALDPRPADAVACERLSAREAVMALVEQTYRLALDDRAALARQLDDIVSLVRRVPVWRLSFPRDLQRVTDFARRVAFVLDQHSWLPR